MGSFWSQSTVAPSVTDWDSVPNAQLIQSLPKVELHLHLEGAVRLSTIVELCKQLNIHVPGSKETDAECISEIVFQQDALWDRQEQDQPAFAELSRRKEDVLKPYLDMFCITKPVQNLTAFLDKVWNVQSLFATTEIIERITYEYIVDAYRQGVKLLEIRYSPQFIQISKLLDHSHLTFDAIHHAVLEGKKRALAKVKNEMAVGIIGVLERAFQVDKVHEAAEYIIHSGTFDGIDIAGDENYRCVKFAEYYQHASSKGLGLTVHAGEATNSESVKDAINVLKSGRIGHGFRSIEDSQLVQQLVQQGTLLEICPVSNVYTSSVKSIQDHPVRQLLDAGVKLCISSDDPGVFHKTILDDYALLAEHHHFTVREFYQCNLYALEASFLPKQVKEDIRNKYFNLPIKK